SGAAECRASRGRGAGHRGEQSTGEHVGDYESAGNPVQPGVQRAIEVLARARAADRRALEDEKRNRKECNRRHLLIDVLRDRIDRRGRHEKKIMKIVATAPSAKAIGMPANITSRVDPPYSNPSESAFICGSSGRSLSQPATRSERSAEPCRLSSANRGSRAAAAMSSRSDSLRRSLRGVRARISR